MEQKIGATTFGWLRFGQPQRYTITATMAGTLLLFLSSATVAKDDSNIPLTIKPDLQTQAQIQRTLNASDEDDLRKQLDRLAEMGGQYYEKLMPQLVWYSVYGKDAKGRRDVGEAMAAAVFVKKLDIHEADIAKSLLPYLGTKDLRLKEELYGIFSGIRFSMLQSIIAGRVGQGQQPPYELIRFMYQKSPGEALLVLGRTPLVTGSEQETMAKWKALLWAEHIVSDVLWKHDYGFLPKSKVEPEAVAQLEKLSKDEAWWVRLYVAEILRQHPAFRQKELVDRLAADQHPLVRQAMADTAEKPKKVQEKPATKQPLDTKPKESLDMSPKPEN